MGKPNMLSGLLYCADCGKKLYQVRIRSQSRDKDSYVCSTYRKVKGGCSAHSIGI